MNAATAVPFVIGQWVCGPRFYGRTAEIAEILGSRERRLWIAGLRRIGKTSLLKQIDFLAAAEARTLPLFWDLQGAGGVDELGLTFTDALLDAEETMARLGIALAEVEDGDLFASLEKLARALRRRGTELLLLCDEADELGVLDRAEPGLAARLWQAVADFAAARVVLASSPRLRLTEPFAAPRYLGGLTDDEARALLRQSQLPAAARPLFDEAGMERLREQCGNHPMLLQIAAKRWHEVGDVEEALRQMAADRTVQHLLAVDFDLLTGAEQQLLRSLAKGRPPGDPAALDRLCALGLVRASDRTITNPLLIDWLRRGSEKPHPDLGPSSSAG